MQGPWGLLNAGGDPFAHTYLAQPCGQRRRQRYSKILAGTPLATCVIHAVHFRDLTAMNTAQQTLVLLISAMLSLTGCASAPGTGSPSKFDIGLIGDQHYDAESEAKFPNIMAGMNRADLAFVVHVGDIGNPAYNSCKDETYHRRRDEFNASRHPFIFTPGDNDWTDCHQGGIPDSRERLAKVREVFFQGDNSLGQRKIPLTRQSADARYASYRENTRWTQGGVVFVTLHVVGSNNNLGRTPEMDAEFAERNPVNIEWMRQAFQFAKQSGAKGIMILTQANPNFEGLWPARRRGSIGIAPPNAKRPSGFTELLDALRKEVLAYDKPVDFVHNDTHYFRVDKPMVIDDKSGGNRGRVVEHFTRVELFGYPEAHWVRATIDPDSPGVFSFAPELVRENYADRWRK